MQTSFSLAQLANPDTAEADRILRACVHCGFCTATCPTYVLLGDELDSPRGRIYLIKGMLESGGGASAEVVKHIDRCLSCLACMTTCPSGVHYMHLVDHARAHIEATYRRPLLDRVMRAALAWLIPDNRAFRWALKAARTARPLAGAFEWLRLPRIAAVLRLAPDRLPRSLSGQHRFPAQGVRRGRIALLTGCVAPVIAPSITRAAIRVLTRHGVEVVTVEGCCGALVHHLGRARASHRAARERIDALNAEFEGEELDAILVTASGCGTMVKDYGFMLRSEDAYAGKAGRVSQLAQDISEYLYTLALARHPGDHAGMVVAYHSACSLQHGQKIWREPKDLLSKLGFVVKDVPEGHLCCGSAGTYNILQPELAGRLRERKVANITKMAPAVIAAGNIGCMMQIAAGTSIPVVHSIELIDWATGGPAPAALAGKGVAAVAGEMVAAE